MTRETSFRYLKTHLRTCMTLFRRGESELRLRYLEVAGRFINMDGTALEAAISRGDCSTARLIWKQLSERYSEHPNYFSVARAQDSTNTSYLQSERQRVEVACRNPVK